MKPSTGSIRTHRERLERAGLRLLSDERLARLAAAGDRAAFAAIFARYEQALYGYCTSLLHDRDDAADAVQSAMVKALGALDGERRHIALRPWLYRIAHNEAIDLLRRPRTDPTPSDEVVSMGDVEGSAATRDHLRTILSDIQQLPERQRGALVMRELGGLDYAEIADALVTSPGAAKQAVYEARQALHELARGRESDCESIRLKLSEADRRVFRGRTVRAHLSACADCRAFQAQIAARESSLAAFAPVLPAALGANAMHGAMAGGAAGAAAGLSASAAAPAIGAVAVVVALGAGAVGLGVKEVADRGDPPRVVAEATPEPPSGTAERRSSTEGSRGARAGNRDEAREARRRARATAPGRREARSDAAARRRKRRRAESATDSAALTGTQPQAGTTSGGGGGGSGIKSWVRGGGGRTGGRSDDSGPVRTGIDETRDTFEDTVTQVQDALPVQTPQLPAPIVRQPEERGGSGRR